MTQNQKPIRVIKIGGSLLGAAQTPERITNWLSKQPTMQNTWIVGGGKLVDVVRQWDEVFSLKPETAHKISIELMDANGKLVSTWFPTWDCTDSFFLLGKSNDHAEHDRNRNQIFLASRWLKENNPLPETWDVTSDSIAATLAKNLIASELVILKSCDPPGANVETMMAEDFVDRHFGNSIDSADFKLRFVNLKNEPPDVSAGSPRKTQSNI